jgi:hypothetical protein
MIQLRQYQIEISNKAVDILNKLKIVYLAMEVRTGKTLTALNTAELYKAKKVLFLTKKKAIQSIINDYNNFGFTFELVVINNESLHLIKDNDFDLLISDEHHRNGAFPKPNKITKLIKERFSKLPMIFLSGTPTPESYSQWYHQFWISNFTPFKEYVNFYKWSNDYVNIKLKYLGYHQVKDYSGAYKDRIDKVINKYIISFTQEQSGFNSKVNENIIKVKMQDITYNIAKELKKNNIFEGKNDVIIADTGVKLMSKLHQLYSGTCILESGKSIILDKSKCIEIENKFKKNKIAIFYKFQAEYDLIKQYFNDKITNDLNEFNTTDKWIALQIVSGREGISLKEADYLVYFNIDYSAVSYWQSRDRLTTIDRKENNIFWIFSDGGIEQHIYNAVMNKKNYTLSVFKKNYNGINIPNKNN